MISVNKLDINLTTSACCAPHHHTSTTKFALRKYPLINPLVHPLHGSAVWAIETESLLIREDCAPLSHRVNPSKFFGPFITVPSMLFGQPQPDFELTKLKMFVLTACPLHRTQRDTHTGLSMHSSRCHIGLSGDIRQSAHCPG